MNNSKTTKFFDQVKLTRSSRLMEDENEIIFKKLEADNDKSPINSFWEGGAQLLIACIYYTIAILFILFGDAVVGYIIGSCAVICNLVWFIFKGRKLFWKWLGKTWFVKWFLNLVES